MSRMARLTRWQRASASTESCSRSSSPRRSTGTSSSQVSAASGQPDWPASRGSRRWSANSTGPSHRLELALVENVQRADLDPLEEVHAYRQLIDEFGYSQEIVAQVGPVANTPGCRPEPGSRTPSPSGRISEGHARALLASTPRARTYRRDRRRVVGPSASRSSSAGSADPKPSAERAEPTADPDVERSRRTSAERSGPRSRSPGLDAAAESSSSTTATRSWASSTTA